MIRLQITQKSTDCFESIIQNYLCFSMLFVSNPLLQMRLIFIGFYLCF